MQSASGGGVIARAGGAESTPSGELGFGTFGSCNASITVLNTGTGEVHTEAAGANGNGTFTTNGAEVTTELAGFHCIWSTANTDSGQVIGGTPAKLKISSAPIPRTGGRSGAFCGSSAALTAEFTVTSPSTLLID